jgi:hypothetical protein
MIFGKDKAPPLSGATGGHDHFTKARVECRLREQILQVQMHSVLPVMTGIGRIIDPFFTGILSAKRIADAQQIL